MRYAWDLDQECGNELIPLLNKLIELEKKYRNLMKGLRCASDHLIRAHEYWTESMRDASQLTTELNEQLAQVYKKSANAITKASEEIKIHKE